MNELQNFKFETSDIRIFKDAHGEPWLVAKDVCEVFGETNYRRALQSLDADEKGVSQMNTPGGHQSMVTVNEAGLYSLLFAMQPSKARGVSDDYVSERVTKLKGFKRWVTHEVLPSIRKTGGYQTPSIPQLPQTYLEALKALVVAEEEKITLAIENIQMKPKAEYFDALVDRSLLTSFRDTAKELGVKEKPFIGFLLEDKYIYRDKKGKLMPYAARNDGYFEVKEQISERTSWAGVQTFVTPKGRETFRLLTQGIN